MEMTLRWYGSKFDTVTLEQIRQIPGVTGVITTLYDTAPGDVWSRERIQEMKAEVAAAGLHVAGIESVNVHDAIKTGSADRDKYIDNYIETLENLGKEDIHLVCYNFMPVFDWIQSGKSFCSGIFPVTRYTSLILLSSLSISQMLIGLGRSLLPSPVYKERNCPGRAFCAI